MTSEDSLNYQYISPDPIDLGRRLSACLTKWGLTSRGELTGGFRAAVFDCVSSEGRDVVVKLSPIANEAKAEAAALRQWSDTGVVVELLDYDDSAHALLLARVRPGTPLPSDDDRLNVEVASQVLAKLHAVPPGRFPFARLQNVYPAWEQRSLADLDFERGHRNEPHRGEEGRTRIPVAQRTAMQLCATATATVLLHGDVCGKNFLWDGTKYLAIDPMPRIGDPCSDVGFFAAGHGPALTTFDRATAIATNLELDAHRARQWAAIWTIHQATQAWRPDQAQLDVLCASAELNSLLSGE